MTILIQRGSDLRIVCAKLFVGVPWGTWAGCIKPKMKIYIFQPNNLTSFDLMKDCGWWGHVFGVSASPTS